MAKQKTKVAQIDPVALNMAAFRVARGLKQKELADKIGLSLSKLARTEIGILKPSIEMVRLFAVHLLITPNELFRAPGPLSDDEKRRSEIFAWVAGTKGKRLERLHKAIEIGATNKYYHVKLLPKVIDERTLEPEDDE